MCGEYDRAEQFLLTGLERELRGPGFGYFIGFQMLLGTVALHRGDMDKAMELYGASTVTLTACDHVYRESFLALTACGMGDLLLRTDNIEAALTEFRRASRLVKEFPRMLGRQRVSIRALAGLAAIHAAQGEYVRAREFLAEATQILEEVIPLPHTWLWEGMPGQLFYALGTANARLGEEELALDFLAAAIAAGWRDAPFLASDPELKGLRSEPRFQALQKQLQDLPALEFQASCSISAHSGIALKR
jgi:tetratricopeptide (TPR) repeat protein